MDCDYRKRNIWAGYFNFHKENAIVSPTTIVNECYDLLLGQATTKGLAFNVLFQYPIPYSIETDATRLKQIIINLCSNALKFTAAGKVEVTVSCDIEHEQIKFIVSDSGIGISIEEKNRIFDNFTQADVSTSRKYGGSGLGLSLSKHLAVLLGGDITVNSIKDIGSEFILRVKTGNLTNTKYIENNSETESHKPPTKFSDLNLTGYALLAEDNADNQILISSFIRKTGVTLDIANNGEEAVDMTEKNNYDIIFMDMQMPKKNGIEAMIEIRRQGYTGIIVALTANATTEDKKKCFDSGANDFVTKPINRKILNAVLEKYLGSSIAEINKAANM